MFTGIVTHIGTVAKIDAARGDMRFYFRSALDPQTIRMGASIACSGCCLTVVDKDQDWFAADVSAETLSKTVLGYWKEGTRLNLEMSLKVGDELGGHIVSGHVDGVATLDDIRIEGDSHRLKVRAPHDLSKFIAQKGSVSLDGVSLTVNEVEGDVFGINIIPHTWIHTTLGDRHPGDELNIEIDLMARYAARLMAAKTS